MQNSEPKLRKSLNISIQSKKYYMPINKIIKEWENKGLSMSTNVCETLLLGYKLSNSIELSKLVNTFEMISKTLSYYYNEENIEEYMKAIENVFSKIISVDGEKLSEFLSNPIKFSSENTVTQVAQKQFIPKTKKEENTIKSEQSVIDEPVNIKEIAVEKENQQEVEKDISLENKIITDNKQNNNSIIKEQEIKEIDTVDLNDDFLFNM
ncbi:TPA: hypothetical protein N2D99_002442 [Clostridium botulinum]|nr:hypothetical protein [Clostridium botulinum]